MRLPNILQKNYTKNPDGYQLKLPLNLEIIIPEDDSVQLLSQFVEEMDLADLYSTYERINKTFSVAKAFEKYRKEDLERIQSDEGILLRVSRSIQVEGSFGELKQDMQFRRYLSRGTENVLAESILLAMARNMNKLHNKIQNDRTGTHLFPLKSV